MYLWQSTLRAHLHRKHTHTGQQTSHTRQDVSDAADSAAQSYNSVAPAIETQAGTASELTPAHHQAQSKLGSANAGTEQLAAQESLEQAPHTDDAQSEAAAVPPLQLVVVNQACRTAVQSAQYHGGRSADSRAALLLQVALASAQSWSVNDHDFVMNCKRQLAMLQFSNTFDDSGKEQLDRAVDFLAGLYRDMHDGLQLRHAARSTSIRAAKEGRALAAHSAQHAQVRTKPCPFCQYVMLTLQTRSKRPCHQAHEYANVQRSHVSACVMWARNVCVAGCHSERISHVALGTAVLICVEATRQAGTRVACCNSARRPQPLFTAGSVHKMHHLDVAYCHYVWCATARFVATHFSHSSRSCA